MDTSGNTEKYPHINYNFLMVAEGLFVVSTIPLFFKFYLLFRSWPASDISLTLHFFKIFGNRLQDCRDGYTGMQLRSLSPFKLFFLFPTIVTTWFHQRKGGWKT